MRAARGGAGWLTLREPATATTHFAMAAASTDPFVAYLAHFLAGRAADLSGQVAESEARYRSALAVLPHAQSATTALAANLFLHGRRAEAYTLVQDAFDARRRPDDPWSLFGYGDSRFMRAYVAQLREAFRLCTGGDAERRRLRPVGVRETVLARQRPDVQQLT